MRTDAATKLIADKYINRDGSPISDEAKFQRSRMLNSRGEMLVLEALRKIAHGQDQRRPLKGADARRIARAALNDVMIPWVGENLRK